MKNILTFLLVLSSLQGLGQADPLLTSSGATMPLWHNPASFGSWNDFSVHSLARLQWLGVTNAPKTLLINMDAKIMVGSRSSLNNIQIASGLNFIANNFGSYSIEQFTIPINSSISIKKTKLAFGLALGFTKQKMISKQTRFDMNVGLFWYGDKFFVGFSTTHLFAPRFSLAGFDLYRQYHFNSGYKFRAGNNFIFPTISLRTGVSNFSFEGMTYFLTKNEFFSIGVGYRFSDSFLAGIAIKHKGFRIGYNMDYNLNSLNIFAKFSHELRLSYFIQKK